MGNCFSLRPLLLCKTIFFKPFPFQFSADEPLAKPTHFKTFVCLSKSLSLGAAILYTFMGTVVTFLCFTQNYTLVVISLASVVCFIPNYTFGYFSHLCCVFHSKSYFSCPVVHLNPTSCFKKVSPCDFVVHFIPHHTFRQLSVCFSHFILPHTFRQFSAFCYVFWQSSLLDCNMVIWCTFFLPVLLPIL